MRTLSILMTSFSTSPTPSNLHLEINSSEQPSPWLNSSTWPPVKSSGFGMTCFTVTFGAISNLTALGVLARVQYRRQSKAQFLLLTIALLLADLGGHVIPGAFAFICTWVWGIKYSLGSPPKNSVRSLEQVWCFFGLCPLLLGCAMAVERCVAITQPFFHTARITLTHVRRYFCSPLLLCWQFYLYLLWGLIPFSILGHGVSYLSMVHSLQLTAIWLWPSHVWASLDSFYPYSATSWVVWHCCRPEWSPTVLIRDQQLAVLVVLRFVRWMWRWWHN